MGVRRLIIWVPLGIFALFLMVVAFGLSNPGERTLRSRLIGKPMPEFALAGALPQRTGLKKADFTTGEPRVLNIFASWCGPCKIEAPQLEELKRRGVPIDGIAIRDKPEDLARFLNEYGDPFERIGADTDSRVQLALGSSGVPETFVIDGRGIIRYQHIGDIRTENVPEIVQAYEAAR
jgi:cytochrome c biogenesis protein CcmG/thiol:disulfide interchange protein DsbE